MNSRPWSTWDPRNSAGQTFAQWLQAAGRPAPGDLAPGEYRKLAHAWRAGEPAAGLLRRPKGAK